MSLKKEVIATNEAAKIAYERFGIKGNVAWLPGELDLNFKIGPYRGITYVLKLSLTDAKSEYLDFQQKILSHLKDRKVDFAHPRWFSTRDGKRFATYTAPDGCEYQVRLLNWLEGRLWSDVNPHTNNLRYDLGQYCGQLTSALQGFDHKGARRVLKWDIAQGLWTTEHLSLFRKNEKKVLSYFQNRFAKMQLGYGQLRKSIVHNDANDHNIVVSTDLANPRVKALIDYGDAIHTQVINDVAVACAYTIMDCNDPLDAALALVKGYHSTYALREEELEYLYDAIAMRLVISVTKSALNRRSDPDNAYLQVSDARAWDVLFKWRMLSSGFAHFSFRSVCGFDAHPNVPLFKTWAAKHTLSLTEIFPKCQLHQVHPIDLSVGSPFLGTVQECNDLELFEFKVNTLQKQHPKKVLAGGYLEPRVLYANHNYEKKGNLGPEHRTVHLGVDFWLPAGTEVSTPFDGEVCMARNDRGDKEYGGFVVLKHQGDGFGFYTLYGHLSPESIGHLKKGQSLNEGARIGYLGDYRENGNWVPHLHFQVLLSLLDYTDDFPGVAYPDQQRVWSNICPDPNHFFNLPGLLETEKRTEGDIRSFREKHLGQSLSLQYQKPLHIVRGSGAYLFDLQGRKYLDIVNNVAHVGHECPTVVKAGQEQMALLNTNTRYLHKNINELAQELLETLPPELSVLHFVNSGSEANELALRMAKAFTRGQDIIASEMGYHGNSGMCVAISSYKFEGRGGFEKPEYTHIFPLPDAFRGKYQGPSTGEHYAGEVRSLVDGIQEKGRKICAFIVEPIISCGGQIELPKGFLKMSYQKVREAGGVCISDEVQTGCGRVGHTFWGFQLHDVVPDIVTIGKPLGNGHPVAAVACTPQIAEAFANGMEYFNTFGGNPVSCAMATAVLETVKGEKLQHRALETGEYLKKKLWDLSLQFPIIGDVRGQGLFLGMELVDRDKNPLPERTAYLLERMKAYGILMSSDGRDHNVLKIKPPLVFDKNHADTLLFYLEKVLDEDFMKLI